MDDPRIDTLWNERAIQRVLARYCRGIDRLDEDLVRSCYHPDARDEHGTFRGSVDEFVEWAFRILARSTSSMHLLANTLIDIRGTVALAESYGIAFHRTEGTSTFEPTENLITGFRFVDRFECRSGDWRIARRVALTEWSRVDDLDGRWEIPASMPRGTRDPSDPVWWLVPEVFDATGSERDHQA